MFAARNRMGGKRLVRIRLQLSLLPYPHCMHYKFVLFTKLRATHRFCGVLALGAGVTEAS
jgi:hypothetical protein